MPNALFDSARVRIARANLAAFGERLHLENLAADYRSGRDPSGNLKLLLEMQELKRKLGVEY